MGLKIMKKKAYLTPQTEIMSINALNMLAMSELNSETFDGGYTGGGSGAGNANKRRNTWGNTNW